MSYETELNGLDQTRLEHLNAEYVRAFMSSDVNWYEEHLVDDFVCIESDGSILNKSQFLSKTAEGPDVADYELQKVSVRIYGGVALVRATGLWTKEDQSSGLVANASPSPGGGFDILAVIQISSVQSGRIHWKSLEGPALDIMRLPYGIDPQ